MLLKESDDNDNTLAVTILEWMVTKMMQWLKNVEEDDLANKVMETEKYDDSDSDKGSIND